MPFTMLPCDLDTTTGSPKQREGFQSQTCNQSTSTLLENVVQIASRRVGRRQDGEPGGNLTDPSSQEIHTADTLSPTLSNFDRKFFVLNMCQQDSNPPPPQTLSPFHSILFSPNQLPRSRGDTNKISFRRSEISNEQTKTQERLPTLSIRVIKKIKKRCLGEKVLIRRRRRKEDSGKV